MVSFRRSFGLVLIGVALLAGCVTHPQNRVLPAQYPAADRARVERNVAVFEAVWDLVNRKHYEPKTHGIDWEQEADKYEPRAAAATNDATLYATINQMLVELKDSHTRALRPDQANVRHSHQRTRTGFSMTRIEKKWVVTDVLPNSPAAAAGVESGWIVTARNGVSLGDRPDFWPKEGESAHWEFLDQHDVPVALTLSATRLSTAALQIVRELSGGFVYLRFDEFDGVDRRWLGRQLRAHREAPGVVIDLRRNPGGETFSLGITIGDFFDHAVDCGTFVTRAGARNVKNSWQFGSAHYHGRVVVLVDNASASAAEIFSAVLKDHRRATIVGRPTAGAVLASWFYHLPDGGELQLSREDYIAPNGRRIEGNGVEPNIVVTRTLADIRAGRDPDLDTALQVLAAAK
jgi:carboxyl-terminal processing protease